MIQYNKMLNWQINKLHVYYCMTCCQSSVYTQPYMSMFVAHSYDNTNCLPLHDLLSEPNEYPALHEHTKLWMVLVQVCEHLPLFVVHSFMSSIQFFRFRFTNCLPLHDLLSELNVYPAIYISIQNFHWCWYRSVHIRHC